MKRLVQLVVFVASILMAAQPAFGYLSCSQGSCSGNDCSAACCGDMPGMSGIGHDASVHWGLSCSSTLEALPDGSRCGQPLPSAVTVTREAAITGTDTQNGRTPVFVPLPVVTPPVSARAGGISLHPALDSRAPRDSTVLFHVLRI